MNTEPASLRSGLVGGLLCVPRLAGETQRGPGARRGVQGSMLLAAWGDWADLGACTQEISWELSACRLPAPSRDQPCLC